MKNPIAIFRKCAGLSQADVAQKLRVSTSTYSRWESGEIAMPRESREALASLLGCHPDFLEPTSGRAMCGGPLAKAVADIYRKHNAPGKVNIKPRPKEYAFPVETGSRLNKRFGAI